MADDAATPPPPPEHAATVPPPPEHAATAPPPPEHAATPPPPPKHAAAETPTKSGRKRRAALPPADSSSTTDLGLSIGERRKLTQRTCVGNSRRRQVQNVEMESEDDDEDDNDNNSEEEEEDDDENNDDNAEIIQSVINVDEDDEVVFDVADFSAKNIISQNQIVDDIKYVLNINLLPLSFFIHSTPNFLICEFFYIF